MDRMRRLTSLWSWLPTFRAVAEHEHLSRAAGELGVSPSAVSRMIGLLEEDVGAPLFERVGRGIRLTEGGRHLLLGVRSAMRLVDESLARVHDRQFVGEVKIASDDLATRAFLLPALDELRAAHPDLLPSVCPLSPTVDVELLSGEVDVALVWSPSARDQLKVVPLGEVSSSVYASPGHPLARKRKLTVRDLLPHPFVLSASEQSSWPLGYRRTCALTVASPLVAAEVCASTELLAVLPDVALDLPTTRGLELVKLPFTGLAPRTIHVQWRAPLELAGRAEAVVDAVRARF